MDLQIDLTAAQSHRPVVCALLTYWPYWPGEALLACRGIRLVAFHGRVIGFPEDRNPFHLPSAEHVDVALIGAWWWRHVTTHFHDRAGKIIREVRRHADYLVGLDGPDRFDLTFPPDAFREFTIVIKFQGLYRDRDLYNYIVGPQYDGAHWAEKVRPRGVRYSAADLAKLRLSVPCFVTEFPAVRQKARSVRDLESTLMNSAIAYGRHRLRNCLVNVFTRSIGTGGQVGRREQVHCLVGLSHVQRIQALRLLSGLSGTHGITWTQGMSAELVSGTVYGGERLPPNVSAQLLDEARPFLHRTMSRLAFVTDLRRHQVAVAPTGYGEITYRHGSALAAGAALVCQDLSHVEMMLPLSNRKNVRFCRPDLADLRPIVEELLADKAQRARIALSGRRDFVRWASNANRILYDGLESHVREGTGARPSPS